VVAGLDLGRLDHSQVAALDRSDLSLPVAEAFQDVFQEAVEEAFLALVVTTTCFLEVASCRAAVASEAAVDLEVEALCLVAALAAPDSQVS